MWVSTDVQSHAFSKAVRTGFKRLFEYIDGANNEAVKIPMTAPVRTTVGAAAGPFRQNNFTVSFFVPFSFQKNGAPKPNNPDVYLEEEAGSFTAYVAQKGGYVLDDWSVHKMVKGLTQALKADGKEVDAETFVTAGYDPPFRIAGRHNEVWLMATDAEQQSKL
ncbi:heme-binding 2-like [Micractinium conductrix]|uniref:Heme-binding 2-like n=1 Tax=Micractinium conductrix TaxID=554055 RepID=A0A2P6VSB3_9CHLO|nr:heme-binding 2-like [Micractinium conductrix]|eukprot:PSC76979.1 heme-binding 2-like [Micractinium conductrix]